MAITISSESVTEGHPDKVCDIISDSLLDAFLAGDPQSRVAVETMATVNTVIVAGEVTSKTRVDVENAVRRALHQIGYTDDKYGLDCKKVEVVVKSVDVDRCVDAIVKAAHTGKIGDGKIFITAVERVVRIRTGELDDAAV